MPISVNFIVQPIPFFSVIVTTHNRPKLLRRALESINQQNKTFGLQIILVSDLNDLETNQVSTEMLSSTDIFIRRDPCTPGDSRNTGLLFATGKYVLFLDDDDAWHPNFLDNLFIQPDIQRGNLVFYDCSRVVERRLPTGPEFVQEDRQSMKERVNAAIYFKNKLHLSCIAFPRNVLSDMKFDARLRTFEDWDFLLSIFDRKINLFYAPVLGSRIFEVHDDTSDRLSDGKVDFGNLLDYLYIYRRHPAPNDVVRGYRAAILKNNFFEIDPSLL
jgi:glycosyltransferase involved in cell wall biosynthesis